MTKDSNLTDLSGADIMTQTEFLRTCLEALLLEPMSETYHREIGRGVRWFLEHCIDEKLENVDAAAVEHYLKDLLNKRVSKIGYRHFYSVLRYFFHYTQQEGVFPNICKGIVLEYKIKKLRSIKRWRC